MKLKKIWALFLVYIQCVHGGSIPFPRSQVPSGAPPVLLVVTASIQSIRYSFIIAYKILATAIVIYPTSSLPVSQYNLSSACFRSLKAFLLRLCSCHL